MIEEYLLSQMFIEPIPYLQCLEARYKYINPELDYYYTEKDYDNFLMVASAWSAIIRKTWRLFIIEGNCEPFEFWNAFVRVFVFKQHILMGGRWDSLEKYHNLKEYELCCTDMERFWEKVIESLVRVFSKN